MQVDFCKVGQDYIKKKLCAIPADKTTKFTTLKRWTEYQKTFPSDVDWKMWRNANGICIVCGKISDYLGVYDFDDAGRRFDAWWQQLPEELHEKLTLHIKSQRGGFHIYIRCRESLIKNEKLARTEAMETLNG